MLFRLWRQRKYNSKEWYTPPHDKSYNKDFRFEMKKALARWQKVAGKANSWNIHDHSHKEKSNDKIRQNPNTKPKSRKDKHRIIITESHTKKPNTKRITSQSSSSEVLALGHHLSPWKMLSTIKINIVKIIINTLVDLKVAFYFIFMKTALTNFITYQRSLHHQSS